MINQLPLQWFPYNSGWNEGLWILSKDYKLKDILGKAIKKHVCNPPQLKQEFFQDNLDPLSPLKIYQTSKIFRGVEWFFFVRTIWDLK